MIIAVKIIGIIIMIIGIAFFAEPGIMKRLLSFCKQGERIYLSGVIRLALGIFLLLTARACNITWIIILFSIILIASSAVIFMLGPKKFGSLISLAERQRTWVLRIMAACVAVFGGIMVYAA